MWRSQQRGRAARAQHMICSMGVEACACARKSSLRQRQLRPASLCHFRAMTAYRRKLVSPVWVLWPPWTCVWCVCGALGLVQSRMDECLLSFPPSIPPPSSTTHTTHSSPHSKAPWPRSGPRPHHHHRRRSWPTPRRPCPWPSSFPRSAGWPLSWGPLSCAGDRPT